jgi:hypothetical protein
MRGRKRFGGRRKVGSYDDGIELNRVEVFVRVDLKLNGSFVIGPN